MSKELKNLSLKEKWDNFLDFVDAPTKARLLDCDYKEGLEQYRYLRTEIENALKRLEEHDKIFKKYDIDDNWLEASLYVIKNHFPMNAEIQLKKLKALEIIKEKKVNVGLFLIGYEQLDYQNYKECLELGFQIIQQVSEIPLAQEEYDLLKEELL